MTGREEIDKKKLHAVEAKLDKYPNYLKGYYYSKSLSIRTMNTYLNIIEKFIDSVQKPIENVTIDDINEYIHSMKDCSDSHKATTYSAFKSFFDYMYKTGKISENPIEHVERAKIKRSIVERNDYLTERELQHFLYNVKNGCGTGRAKAFQKYLRSRDCAMCYIFLHTGMRLSALAELNIEDLDFDNKSIRVITKGEKIKVYNGLNVCFDYIQEWIKDRGEYVGNEDNALFVSKKGNRLSDVAIENIIKKYASDIRGKNITPHKLRATYATMLYNKGVDLDTLCELMGHSQVETTRIYIRGRENKSADAARIMSKICD